MAKKSHVALRTSPTKSEDQIIQGIEGFRLKVRMRELSSKERFYEESFSQNTEFQISPVFRSQSLIASMI